MSLIQYLADRSYAARYVLLNAPNITDYKRFPARVIDKAEQPFYFTREVTAGLTTTLNQCAAITALTGRKTLEAFLEETGTTAFLVAQNDTILYEQYGNGYNHDSINSSFSIAKSIVSALVGIALEGGAFEAITDPVSRYLPELGSTHWRDVTIEQLLMMSSGLQYKEHSFLPWQDEPRVYYSRNLRRLAAGAKPLFEAGTRFHYNNYNLVIMGMLLQEVTQQAPSLYLQEKIWKAIGTEAPASWSLDSIRGGMEKMESGINARAIDFLKFGRLYLNGGNWNGSQVIPKHWIERSTQPLPGAAWKNYSYLWWIPSDPAGSYMAVGNLGQFLFICPQKRLLILRMGKKGGPRGWQRIFPALFREVASTLP